MPASPYRCLAAGPLLALVLACGGVLMAEDGSAFARALAASERACAAADGGAFATAFADALSAATDGTGDGAEMHQLSELLGAYVTKSGKSAEKDVYRAWLEAATAALGRDVAAIAAYPPAEAVAVIQAQADIAFLLLRLDGNPFLDAQTDRSKAYGQHLQVVGRFVGVIARASGEDDKPVDLYALSDEASKALAASGEPFLAGGDPMLLKDARARELVRRDYARNRSLADLAQLRRVQRDTADRLEHEVVRAVRAMIAARQMTKPAAVKALASPAVPQATWQKLIGD